MLFRSGEGEEQKGKSFDTGEGEETARKENTQVKKEFPLLKEQDNVVDEKDEQKNDHVFSQGNFGEPTWQKGGDGKEETRSGIVRMDKEAQELVEEKQKEKEEDTIANSKPVEIKERDETAEPSGVAQWELGQEVALCGIGKTGEIEGGACAVDLKETVTARSRKGQFRVVCESVRGFGDGTLVTSGKKRWFCNYTHKDSVEEGTDKREA